MQKNVVVYGSIAAVLVLVAGGVWGFQYLQRGRYVDSMHGGMMYPMSEPAVMPMYDETGMAYPGTSPYPGEAGIELYDSQKMMDSYSDMSSMIYPNYPAYAENASFSVVTSDPAALVRDVRGFVLSNQGKVMSSSTATTNRVPSATISFILPKERFADLSTKLEQQSKKIVADDFYTNDRTGALEDAQAVVAELQLQKTQKELELEQATASVAEARAKAELARIERQLKIAERNVATAEDELRMVSVYLTAAENSRYFDYMGPYPTDHFSAAWNSLSYFLQGILGGAIWIAVYSLLLVPAGIFTWLAVRTWRKSR